VDYLEDVGATGRVVSPRPAVMAAGYHSWRKRGLFCLTEKGSVPGARFVADVVTARRGLTGHNVVCNLCVNRYEFSVWLVAAMAGGMTTVLPPSKAEATVAAALDDYSAPLVVTGLSDLGDGASPPELDLEPSLRSEPAGEVHVFTSGSTGMPTRHLKNWHILAAGGNLAAEIIRRAGLDPLSTAVLGTTPHQHMFGLEATIFAALAHGSYLLDLPVFYPADVERAVRVARDQGIERIALVTSPPHLRFLSEAIFAAPEIRCVISATAPLHRDLAARIEANGHCKVFEIYGSTETGSLAWRQTTKSDLWQLHSGFTVSKRDTNWCASAPHLEGMIPLGDDLELMPDGKFRLIGRRGDLIRVAGKRQNLAGLNAALAAMPTLRDGAVLCERGDAEDRLFLFIVNDPTHQTEAEALRRQVRTHMLKYVDPVFVPRQIHIVPSIPRDQTGKISADYQAALLRSALGTAVLPKARGRDGR